MNDQYLTIAKDFTWEQEIKKSRFICSLARVDSEVAAKNFISQIQTEHRKANHHCFAYTIGDQFEIKRESDNGEPQGTAGMPILNTLEMEQLHNVVAVVTRYFGGVKLGSGGLIRAYGGTTSAAIHEVGLVARVLQTQLIITVSYATHEKLKYFLTQHDLTITNEEFGADVTLTVPVNDTELTSTQAALVNQFNDQLLIKIGTPQFQEIPYP